MAGELPDYTNWLRKRPCLSCGATQHVEAHHATNGLTHPPGERPPKVLPGKRGKGQKAHDYYAFSLCLRCHRQLHDRSGAFKDMSKQRLDAWQLEQVTACRAEWEELTGSADDEWLKSLPF